MTILLFVIVGLVGGALSGMVGIGGGIIIVPLLALLAGFSQKSAQGTTLAMLALPVGIFAAATYFKAGYVNLKATLWVAIGFVVGALISSHYAVKLPDQTVTRVFGAVLLVIATKLLLFSR